jgi:serine 3-dehydrogenase
MTVLAGKIALVTGASAGIGDATARSLAAEGMRVIVAARREDRLESLRRELEASRGPDSCLTLALDVRDRASVQQAARRVEEAGWGEIEVLVNNAGLAAGLAPLQDGRFEHWDRMIDTNVKGLLNVTHWVVRGMVERSSGHIVNIGSISGREVYPDGNVYCATKYAVRALNKAMRIDLRGRGVRVTTVDPGMVETEFSIVRFDGDVERAEKVYEGTRPLTPQDVADAIVWAVSRPPHVNVEELLLMPTDQAAATFIERQEPHE